MIYLQDFKDARYHEHKKLEVDLIEAIPEAHLPSKVELPVTWEYTRYVFQNGGSESTTSHRELGNSYLSFSP